MSHTPGPWSLYQSNKLCIESPSGNIALCNLARENFDDAKLIAAAPDLLAALVALTTNKHLSLGDLVYTIRERELEGWEGPSVVAWSEAVTAAKAAIKKATE